MKPKIDFVFKEFHVIGLPDPPRELREESDRAEQWARFIRAEGKSPWEDRTGRHQAIPPGAGEPSDPSSLFFYH